MDRVVSLVVLGRRAGSHRSVQVAFVGSGSGASVLHPRLPLFEFHSRFHGCEDGASVEDRVSVFGATQDASGLSVGAFLPGTVVRTTTVTSTNERVK